MIKIFLPLLLLIHLAILSRLAFTAWPEMLSYPYLFLNGFTFYKDFIMPYPPALPLFLSGIYSLFGITPEVLKIITWLIVISGDILLFLILRKILKSRLLALPFLAVYIILQSFFEGNMLWFDFATVAPLLAAFLFIIKWLENEKLNNLFWAGFFLGLAVLVKQTAGIYLLGAGGFLLFRAGFKELKALSVGCLVVVIPLFVYLAITATFIPFFNWVLLYPLTEWSKFPGYVDFAVPKRYMLAVLLLIAPLLLAFTNRKMFTDKHFLLTFLFLAAAAIAVYPRFSFFHLQPAVAFVVILSAMVFFNLHKKIQKAQLVLMFLSAAIILKIVYPVNLGEPVRFYGDNEKRISREISYFSEQKIYLLGLNSSLYVFSKTLPPKNWSDNFGWYLEINGVQEWVVEGLEKDPPEKILWRAPLHGLWYKPGVYQPEKVVNYINLHYDKDREIEQGLSLWTRKN